MGEDIVADTVPPRSWGWAGSAAEARQHQTLSRRLAAAEETHRQLAACLAALEEKTGQLWQHNLDLAVRVASVEGESRSLAARLVAAETRSDELSQEKRELAARLTGVDQRIARLWDALTATVPNLVKAAWWESPSEAAAAQNAASRGSSSDQQLAAGTLSTAPAQKPLPIGLLFAHGGLAYVGMMSGVKGLPAVRDMLQKANLILGCDVLKLCLEGPRDKFEENRDPLAYVAGLAGLEKLRNERQEAVTRAQVVAGLGIGDFAALKAAGVFSFEDGLRLAKLYGEAGGECARAIEQASFIITGLAKPKLVNLCAVAKRTEGRGAVCDISWEFFPGAFGVGGTLKSIRALKDLTEKAGAEARLVDHMANHTPLMEPFQQKLRAALDELLPNMNPPRTTVYLPTAAVPVRPGANPKDIVELLKKHQTSRVRWERSVKAMIQEGVSEFFEVGPGQELRNWMRSINLEAWRTMTSLGI